MLPAPVMASAKGLVISALAVLGVAVILASCDLRCSGSVVDYTIPPSDIVLGRADALVEALVVGFPIVNAYTLEAELNVTDVLVQTTDPTMGTVAEGLLVVGAYDDPCGRRTGLRFANDDVVLVALRWVGDNATWGSPWRAYPVLSQDAGGQVTFLDTGDSLNRRIDEILGGTTVERLIAVISETD